MRTFKTIDFLVQVLLIAVFAIIALIKEENSIFIGYFTVGGWQLVSMFIHFTNKWNVIKGGRRYYYQIFVITLCIVTAVSIPVQLVLFPLYFLLFASPFLAVYYAWICYREVFHYSKRPLELI